MVDEFQHHVYEKPDMTSKQRNDLWLELEGRYRPYLDQEGFPFYGEGRRWQAQSHIYVNPFYYIDYCLAQTVALAFWAEAQDSHKQAWDKYVRLVNLAGKKTFSDLLADVGQSSPFIPETLKTIADATIKWLEAQ
jgi:oligoendopeptidase F